MSDTKTVSPLRQRMIEDMAARTLNPHTQRSHISSCKRFAAWPKRSPDRATPDEVRRFQLHLIESGASICNRNRIMTGVRFLFRVTLSRLHNGAGQTAGQRVTIDNPSLTRGIWGEDDARNRNTAALLGRIAMSCALAVIITATHSSTPSNGSPGATRALSEPLCFTTRQFAPIGSMTSDRCNEQQDSGGNCRRKSKPRVRLHSPYPGLTGTSRFRDQRCLHYPAGFCGCSGQALRGHRWGSAMPRKWLSIRKSISSRSA
jgi:Phage integrase, N-terminal SAM-like domain